MADKPDMSEVEKFNKTQLKKTETKEKKSFTKQRGVG